MHAAKRPRQILDSYFEKASGSGSEASTQTCMGVYVFSMKNEVPIVTEPLRENPILPHPPLGLTTLQILGTPLLHTSVLLNPAGHTNSGQLLYNG